MAEETALHNGDMKWPVCQSEDFSKNGLRRWMQYYVCKDCHKQFPAYHHPQGYSQDQATLPMYLNGMGFRAMDFATKNQSLAGQSFRNLNALTLIWVVLLNSWVLNEAIVY